MNWISSLWCVSVELVNSARLQLHSGGFVCVDGFVPACLNLSEREMVAAKMNERRYGPARWGLTPAKPRSVFHKDVLFPGMLIRLSQPAVLCSSSSLTLTWSVKMDQTPRGFSSTEMIPRFLLKIPTSDLQHWKVHFHFLSHWNFRFFCVRSSDLKYMNYIRLKGKFNTWNHKC